MAEEKKSIVPPTGDFGTNWYSKFVLPQGLQGAVSVGGWTLGNEGFTQQTFLGASITSFNINAGFGDTTSTLSINLVNDEYNKSDDTGLGLGDDVYHNGQYDVFSPPPVGTPVFFKFGKWHSTIEQAWRKTFDDTYGYNTLPEENLPEVTLSNIENAPPYHFLDLQKSDRSKNIFVFKDLSEYYDPIKGAGNLGRGRYHFSFGGILQSYTQNKGPDGNPIYSVQVVDPREILSNCTVILKNYAGSIFNYKNYFNVFGFLEHDVSDTLKAKINQKQISGFSTGPIATEKNWVTTFPFPNAPNKILNNLEKIVDPNTGGVFYYGNDMYRFPKPNGIVEDEFPEFFPITGQGYARVSDQGIPWYRIRQALEALFNYNGFLPQEYVDAGYGGPINFRGFNYVVDFSGIPLEKIPQMYFMDFEQLDLLSMAQELCDIISHDMFVSLLPVIDHPASKFLYDYNNYWIAEALKFPEGSVDRDLRLGKVVTGIIRIDAINKSDAPSPGSIKAYLENIAARGIHVKNQDVGYELSNVETDKIVVGAQEVEMYYFTNAKDRDNLQVRRRNLGLDNGVEELQGSQWSLDTMLKQQVIPFYGFLGKDVPTIPRGFGSYQQIMLDATGLDAYGVGNYYIATEMELRAALVSYERWRDFLLQYNNTYIEEVGENQILLSNISAKATGLVPGLNDILNKYGQPSVNWENREFGVSVPRCVFDSDKNYMDADGLPASKCSPPYGYPLYYQRASSIGIPEAGLVGVQAAFTKLSQEVNDPKKKEELSAFVNFAVEARTELLSEISTVEHKLDMAKSSANQEEIANTKKAYSELKKRQKTLDEALQSASGIVGFIKDFSKNATDAYKNVQRTGKKTMKNARKVYDFVKGVAEEHLGKTFLVKIPKACNVLYSKDITLWEDNDPTFNIKNGPFGFKPQTVTSNIGYYANNGYETDANILLVQSTVSASDYFEHYIYNEEGTYYTTGALKNNFNPISEKWEFNYEPEPQGGFFNYSIYNKNIPFGNIQEYNLDGSKLSPATMSLLAPQDLTTFVNNGRIQAYVRFNDSQYIDFSSFPKDSFTQQAYSAEGFIPDILDELDNVDSQANEKFGENAEFQKPRTVAFVKCTIDPQFYMPPKIVTKESTVWAREVRFMPNFGQLKFIETRDEQGCKVKVPVEPYAKPIFWIDNGGTDGATATNTDFLRYYDAYTNSYLVKTDTQSVDPDHVYALITLPGKAIPTIETRYRDSTLSAINNTKFKNIMTVDVVKGVPGFEKPPTKSGKKTVIDCNHPNLYDLNLQSIVSALEAHRSTLRAISLDSPHTSISFTSPSPIHPDLIALPLMSKERCYGPWLSASVLNAPGDTRLRYSDIGGKVQFVKNENLAPWNYAGYQLMNEAGTLEAQFSNSLLLFTERGGFSFPEAPTGISLAKALLNGGPLITSISVDINNEISTTIKMDLYTSRFGKLQKQKELAIGEVIRQRQKITDQTNANIRRGMGKNATNASAAQLIMNNGGNKLKSLINNRGSFYSDIEKATPDVRNLVIKAEKNSQDYAQVNNSPNVVGSNGTTSYTHTSTSINASLQTDQSLIETTSMFVSPLDAQEAYESTASVNFGQIFTPASTSPQNKFLPTLQSNSAAILIQKRNLGED